LNSSEDPSDDADENEDARAKEDEGSRGGLDVAPDREGDEEDVGYEEDDGSVYCRVSVSSSAVGKSPSMSTSSCSAPSQLGAFASSASCTVGDGTHAARSCPLRGKPPVSESPAGKMSAMIELELRTAAA
jgi:hypothetical protein